MYIVLFITLAEEGIFVASICYIILVIIWVLPLMRLRELLDDAQSVEGSTETRTLGLTDPYLFITYPHATIKWFIHLLLWFGIYLFISFSLTDLNNISMYALLCSPHRCCCSPNIKGNIWLIYFCRPRSLLLAKFRLLNIFLKTERGNKSLRYFSPFLFRLNCAFVEHQRHSPREHWNVSFFFPLFLHRKR